MKRNIFVVGIMVWVIILVLAGCGDNDPKTYTVTIGSLTNGSITANPMSGVEGTEIKLTVNPEDLYRLKAGTLKYGSKKINETTMKFNLPAENVTVNAEFESRFIGNWQWGMGDVIFGVFSFFGNTFTEQFPNGKYAGKGTWVIEDPNKIICTYTHIVNNSIGVETVEDLPKIETDIVGEWTFEFLSNSLFTLNIDGVIYTFTL